jgi:hypothetical protein
MDAECMHDASYNLLPIVHRVVFRVAPLHCVQTCKATLHYSFRKPKGRKHVDCWCCHKLMGITDVLLFSLSTHLGDALLKTWVSFCWWRSIIPAIHLTIATPALADWGTGFPLGKATLQQLVLICSVLNMRDVQRIIINRIASNSSDEYSIPR